MGERIETDDGYAKKTWDVCLVYLKKSRCWESLEHVDAGHRYLLMVPECSG